MSRKGKSETTETNVLRANSRLKSRECARYFFQPSDESAINNIVEAKRNLNPWVMVSETHKAIGAWDQTYKNGQGNHHVIPIDLIKAVG